MTASIFTPKDNSLQSRVSAWKQVYQAYEQLNASKQSQGADWQDRLGEQADIEFAQQTITHSFSQACASLSTNELKQAQEQGLLTKQDIQAIVVSQRTAKLNQSHQQSQQQSNQQSRGRTR